MRTVFTLLLLVPLAASGATSALAHEGVGAVGGVSSGFLHPLLGPDHLVAMVAVGLWGAFLRAPAIYILPVVFPLVMAVGGVMGISGVPLPYVETGIAASAVALGLAVALAVRAPLAVAAVIVGFFAIFHGHAHGTELPGAADPLAFGIGFVIATGLLHLFGIAIGALVGWPWGVSAIRGMGALIAASGIYFLAA